MTVSWSASSFTNGGAAPAYVVRRYSTATGIVQTVGAACSGSISALSCTESGVPSGSWQYTITPAASNWRGTESTKSAAVVV